MRRGLMTHSRVLAALASGLALAGCTNAPRGASHPVRESPVISAAPAAPAPSPAPLPSPTITLTRESLSPDQAAMLDAINQYRRAERCPALVPDDQLMAIAQAHAIEIAGRREASHRSVDGATLAQRLMRGNYAVRRSGEVIAVSRESPVVIVDEWMREPVDGSHRREIADCFYGDVGIGVARTDSGIDYWVIVFAERG